MALEESPPVIGEARRSLDTVGVAQELQAAAWLMTFLNLGAVAAALTIHRLRQEQPGVWLVLLYTLPILLIGGPAWMALVVRPVLMAVTQSPSLGRVGRAVTRGIVLAGGIVVPAAAIILSTLFLFSRPTSAALVPGRCGLDLKGTVTTGGDAGHVITGHIRVAIAPGGTLAVLDAEENGKRASVLGAVIRAGALRLVLDLGDGKTVVGALAPFTGCSDTLAHGTFTGPAGWNTKHVDRGRWSLVRATGS
jgi:hypothetical protein